MGSLATMAAVPAQWQLCCAGACCGTAAVLWRCLSACCFRGCSLLACHLLWLRAMQAWCTCAFLVEGLLGAVPGRVRSQVVMRTTRLCCTAFDPVQLLIMCPGQWQAFAAVAVPVVCLLHRATASAAFGWPVFRHGLCSGMEACLYGQLFLPCCWSHSSCGLLFFSACSPLAAVCCSGWVCAWREQYELAGWGFYCQRRLPRQRLRNVVQVGGLLSWQTC